MAASPARWRSTKVALGVAIALALLLVALPRRRDVTPPSLPTQLEPAVLQAVVAVLTPPDDGRPLDPQALVTAILAQGPAALPTCVALACGLEALPPFPHGDPAGRLHPRALAVRDEVLRTAIAAYSPEARLDTLSAFAGVSDVGTLRVLFQWIGEIDHAMAVGTLVASGEGVEPIQWRSDYVRRPFEGALEGALRRRPDGVWELRARLRELEVEFAAVIVRAAAGAGNKLSVEFAIESLGRETELDLGILGGLARSAHDGPLAYDQEVADQVRRKLDDADPLVRRAAMDACGALGDVRAVERLANELDGDDALLVQAAHRALTAIVGVDRGRESDGWKRWVDDELAWEESDFERLVEQLEAPDAGVSTRAMRELASHPLFRDEAAEALAHAVADDDVPSRAAVEALAATCSSRALEPLTDALDSDDEAAVRVAHAALERLTGVRREADASAWRALLGR